jgi:hypothetical protein
MKKFKKVVKTTLFSKFYFLTIILYSIVFGILYILPIGLVYPVFDEAIPLFIVGGVIWAIGLLLILTIFYFLDREVYYIEVKD